MQGIIFFFCGAATQRGS